MDHRWLLFSGKNEDNGAQQDASANILEDSGIHAMGLSWHDVVEVRVPPDQYTRAWEIIREAIRTHQLDGLQVGVVEDDAK
jgi:hypothetical protein